MCFFAEWLRSFTAFVFCVRCASDCITSNSNWITVMLSERPPLCACLSCIPSHVKQPRYTTALERGAEVSVFLPACRPVCWPACLSVCLSVRLSACLPVCQFACHLACLPACLSVLSYVCLCAGVVVAQCKVSGPVSAAVAFDHQHRLVFVATLSAQLQAFHVSGDHLSLW